VTVKLKLGSGVGVEVSVADGSGECVAVMVLVTDGGMVAEGGKVFVELLAGVNTGGDGAQAVIVKSTNARMKQNRLNISLSNQCNHWANLHMT